MASLYADENLDYPVVHELRFLGHDVLTAQEAGQAQQRIPDAAVLAFATACGRAVLTFNRRHFFRQYTPASSRARETTIAAPWLLVGFIRLCYRSRT